MKSHDQILILIPNSNQHGPALALTHVSVLPDKAPGQETHSQSCRGKDNNHQNDPKPEGFSFSNPEQSRTVPLQTPTSRNNPWFSPSHQQVCEWRCSTNQSISKLQLSGKHLPHRSPYKVVLSFPPRITAVPSPISPACATGILSAACFPDAAAVFSLF